MRLTGLRPYHSINQFDGIDLPQFSLIIGPNGAGKSHLLEAIQHGAVHCDVFGPIAEARNSDGLRQILRMLRNGDPLPDSLTDHVVQKPDEIFGRFLPHGDNSIIAQLEAERCNAVQRHLPHIENAIGGSLSDIAPNEGRALSTPVEDLIGLAEAKGLQPDATEVVRICQQIVEEIGNFAELNPDPLYGFSKANWQSVLTLPIQDLMSVGSWGHHSAFQINYVKIFSDYKGRQFANRFLLASGEDMKAKALSDEEFERTWGQPPWEKVSNVLESFGFPYRIQEPSDDPQKPIRFMLVRLDGQQVSVDALSSGEKILLQFALASLDVDEERVNLQLPKLLLLDEVDASLHPKNVHRLLEAIQSGFVDGLGIPVILTTHSPTTVALAPEDAVFEMTETERVPRPITKQQALNRLTVDLPILAIDYSGRRQVFVESSVDADQYERLYTRLKAQLDLPRTLNFVAAAGKAQGDRLGGCSVVTRIVEALAENGVSSLYGLIDWDGKNEPHGRIKVLGHGTHYSKENLLLDPLLVGILLMMDSPNGMVFPLSLPDIAGANGDELQRIADIVTHRLDLSGEVASSAYLKGPVLSVPKEYQTMNGHRLEERLLEEFPSLNRYGGGGKWLPDPIINRVLSHFPGFCPLPLADIFREIAEEQPA